MQPPKFLNNKVKSQRVLFRDAGWVNLLNNPEMISRMYMARKAEASNYPRRNSASDHFSKCIPLKPVFCKLHFIEYQCKPRATFLFEENEKIKYKINVSFHFFESTRKNFYQPSNKSTLIL